MATNAWADLPWGTLTLQRHAVVLAVLFVLALPHPATARKYIYIPHTVARDLGR